MNKTNVFNGIREPPNGQTVLVKALKYDGHEHRRWKANLIQSEKSLIVLDAKFETDVYHELIGTIVSGTSSVEYYWLDRWYNIFRFSNSHGRLLSYYCNVNIPPDFNGRQLIYVDLDIDILVQPDFSYQILDEDEFNVNAIRFDYPVFIKSKAQQAVNELTFMIEEGQFPFQMSDT
jgi:protein associated with RNAse G/E